jgi:opacity protein-like surface antigen
MKHTFQAALLVAAASFALASGAAANDAVMDGLIGNTIVVTFPGGHVTKVYVEAAHAYSVSHDGTPAKGTWSDDGKETCYTETDPAPPAGTKPICLPSIAHKVGDSWVVPGDKSTVEGAKGNADGKAVVVAGHQ